MISERAKRTFNSAYYIADHIKSIFDPLTLDNKDGYMNFTVAENVLCWDILKEKMSKSQTFPPGVNGYTLGRGFPVFLEAMSKYIEKYFTHYPVSPYEICTMAGSASAINASIFGLLDAGDAILCIFLFIIVPTPNYSGLPNDFMSRNDNKMIFADTIPYNYQLPIDLLESTYVKATNEGEKIKCLFLVHPLNPIGITYSFDELKAIADWCKEKKIHLVY